MSIEMKTNIQIKDNLKEFLKVKNSTETNADLFFYGDIVCDEWDAWTEEDQYPLAIKDFLTHEQGKDLNIYINSGGGSVFAGMAIYNMLKRHQGFKTVYIDGVAASIASVIALAGDRVVIPSNAYFMIHKPWLGLWGAYNSDKLIKSAEDLDRIEEGILNVYKENLREGIDIEEIKEMLKNETWFTGREASNYFDFEVDEVKEVAACVGNYFNKYDKIPNALKNKIDKINGEKENNNKKRVQLRLGLLNLGGLKMTREEYFKKRQEMIDEAQKLLDDEVGEEGTGEEKTEEAEKIANKIKALDEEYERNAKARANLKALQDSNKIHPTIFNLTNNKGRIEGTEDTFIKDEQEKYKNAWAKDMLRKPLSTEEEEVFNKVNMEYKAEVQTTESNTILIPKTVATGIWKEIGDMYPLFGDTSPTFVKGDLTIIAEEDGGDDAEWYDEETEVKEDGYKLKEITLKGCDLSKDITVSWKLRKMSIDEFIPYITTLLAEKMGAALAKAIINGKGKPGESDSFKPQPLGIKTVLSKEINKTQIIEYTDKIAYTDITKLMSVLNKWSNGACIYANSTTIWTQLAEILDTTGKPIFIPDTVNSDGIGRLFGRVVKMDDSMADGEILAGNITKGYAININEDVTLYTEEHVKSRKTDYLTYSLVDGNVISSKAFGMIVKKTSAVTK